MTDVTVVLPVWDEYVRFLPEALRSLSAQEPVPHVVVVDNRSSVRPELPPDVEVVRAPKRVTLGAARSLGLGAVRTEFVVFWDADDVMPPGTLAALVARLRSDPRLVLAAARIAEGPQQPHHWPRPFTARLTAVPRLFALVNAVSSLVPTVGALLRTDAVRAAGGFPDLETGDDWSLGVGLSLRGRCTVIPQVGRIYHQHGDSLWARRQTPPHLAAHAAVVRRRIVEDPASPRMLRAARPLVGVAQWLVIRVLRPIRLRVRG